MISEAKKKLLLVGFIVTLLYSLHFAIPIYVNAIMLSEYFTPGVTSLIIMIGAICALIVTTHLGKYIRRYHNYETTLLLILVSMVATALIGIVNVPYLVAFFYVIHFSCVAALFIMVNLYIEEFTDVDEEGATRGLFLTLLNTGILIAPLIAGGLINTQYRFTGIYIVSSLCLFPVIFLIRKFYSHVREPKYTNINYKKAMVETLMDRNIFGSIMALIALESFYVLMSVYSGVYIVETIGIPINVFLGVIMPFALIPFVLLPYGLGKLADTKTGEKEMMIGGIVVIAIATIAMSFVTSTNPLIWALLLFVARLGGAMLEAMIFSYFFKKVERSDAGIVTLFGSIRTIAFILVPLLGSLFFIFSDNYKILFVLAGILLLTAIIPVLKIRDTR